MNAPKLEKIGYAAFTQTSISEFEVSENLTFIDSNAFEQCEKFETFYVMVDGEKVTTADLGNVRVEDGVLYVKVANGGYILKSYPQAKNDKSLKVIDGTIRIEFCAAYNNKFLETVEFPASLLYIGNHAFDGCENLTTVKFNSYYAPALEGTWSGTYDDITPENKDDFIAFEELYGRNYYYYTTKKVSFADMYHYSTFKGDIGSVATEGLVCIIPENSYGYDSHMYSTYFTVSEEETSGKVMGSYAIAFVNAVNKLPEVATKFDGATVSAAIDAYNALVDRVDELAFVDAALIERFNTVRSEYYVSVVEDKIEKLFGMYNNEYCFNIVKDARESFLDLTEAEQGMVANGAVLNEKIAALTAAMGVTPDFSKTYSEHFATEEPPVNDPNGNGSASNNDTLVLILIIAGAVIVLAGAGVVTFIIIKRKKVAKTAPQAEQTTQASESSKEENDETSTEVEDN